MRISPLRPLALVPAVLVLAACGSDSPSSSGSGSQESEAAAPAVALKEAGETRRAIEGALATYRSGDRAGAEDQVAEAYVQHFEKVEDALGAKDDELKERLEESISGDLRTQMKAQKPPAEVERTARAVLADLSKAEALLR